MKLSDIVYPITKPNVELAISIYHRKIFFSHASRIPKDRPVLFISNHPTAFLEPVIYAGLLDKPIHSLVRGDFFQNNLAKAGLESLNMVAIYRMRDGGVEGLRKNAMTFQYCYDLLAQHRQVLIMAEGFTNQQKRLGPLQKGAARVALGAAQKKKLEDLVIISLGANFTEANEFRGEFIIEVGTPLPITKYLTQYKKDKKAAIDGLTNDMAIAMRKTIIHVEEEADDDLFEIMVSLARRKLATQLWPSWERSDQRFQLEKKLADKINDMSIEDKKNWKDQLKDYPMNTVKRSDRNILNWVIMIIGFPFWCAGVLYRSIPFGIARNIVQSKVEVREFESPIRFGMGAMFFILWSFLLIGLLGFAYGLKAVWLPFAFIFVVWFSLIYEDIWCVLQHHRNWTKISNTDRAVWMKLESEVKSMI